MDDGSILHLLHPTFLLVRIYYYWIGIFYEVHVTIVRLDHSQVLYLWWIVSYVVAVVVVIATLVSWDRYYYWCAVVLPGRCRVITNHRLNVRNTAY